MAKTAPSLNASGITDETRRSQGYTDNALGNLFSNIGSVGDQFISSTDRAVRYDIKEQVRNVSDSLYAKYAGVDPGIQGGINGTMVGAQPYQQVSADMAADSARLRSIRRKFEAGKIDSDMLNLEAAAWARMIKARKPGYQDVVDNELRRNGFTPAQDLLRANMAAAKSGAGSEDFVFKKNYEAVQYAINQGITMDPSLVKTVTADPFGSARNPEVMANVRMSIQKWKNFKDTTNASTALLNEQAAKGKQDKELTVNTLGALVKDKVFGPLYNSDLYGKYNDLISKVTAEGGNGPETAKNLTELRNTYIQMRAEMQKRVDSIYADPKNAKWITLEARESVDKLVKGWMTRTEQALQGGDVTMLGNQVAVFEKLKDMSFSEFARSSPDIFAVQAVRKVYGDQGALWALQNSPNGVGARALQATSQFLVRSIEAGLLETSQYNSIMEALQANFKDPNFKPEVATEVVHRLTALFKSADNNPKYVQAAFAKVFGKANDGMFNAFKNPTVARKIYEQMADPKVMDNIMEYEKNKVLTANQRRSFAAFILANYGRANSDILAEGRDLNGRNKYAEIVYDNNNGYFKYLPRPVEPTIINGPQQTIARFKEDADVEGRLRETAFNQAERVVAKLNKTLPAVNEILVKGDINPRAILSTMMTGFRTVNADPTTGPDGNGPRTEVKSDTQDFPSATEMRQLEAQAPIAEDRESTTRNRLGNFATMQTEINMPPGMSPILTYKGLTGDAPNVEILERTDPHVLRYFNYNQGNTGPTLFNDIMTFVTSPQNMSDVTINRLAKEAVSAQRPPSEALENEWREMATALMENKVDPSVRRAFVDHAYDVFKEWKSLTGKEDELSEKDVQTRIKKALTNRRDFYRKVEAAMQKDNKKMEEILATMGDRRSNFSQEPRELTAEKNKQTQSIQKKLDKDMENFDLMQLQNEQDLWNQTPTGDKRKTPPAKK